MPTDKLIDMYAVQVFIAVAETGSMSGAATRMGISQSGASQMVRQLEEELGVVLVDRSTRPMTLTPFGVALKNRGSLLSEELLHLKAQVLDAGRGVKPDLRIGVVDSFASTCGSMFTKKLLGRVAQLSMRTGLSPQQGESLLRRDLDLIVTSDPLMDANVERYRIFSEKYFVITPRETRNTLSTIDDVKALANVMPVVRFNRVSQVGLQIERHLRALDIRVPNRLELDNADALTSMVAEGIGWAVTSPMCFLQAAPWVDRVKVHLAPDLGLERSLYLVARRDEYSSFFAEACAIAQSVVQETFIPRLTALGQGVEALVHIDEEVKP